MVMCRLMLFVMAFGYEEVMFAYEAVVFGHEAVFQECVDGDAGGRIWGHGVRRRGVRERSGRMRGARAARKEQLHWMIIFKNEMEVFQNFDASQGVTAFQRKWHKKKPFFVT